MAKSRSGARPPAVSPGEGEQRAQRGFQNQYQRSASLVYAALLTNELHWLSVADPSVGILDDLVLGLNDKVVGHQFKSSNFPEPFRLKTLLIGADGVLADLIASWQKLKILYPAKDVEVRFLTTDYPSVNDELSEGAEGHVHSAALLAELEQNVGRSLAEWQTTKWRAFFDVLVKASGLDGASFDAFLRSLRIVVGQRPIELNSQASASEVKSTSEIAKLLPELVADRAQKTTWSREELLGRLRWSDAIGRRRAHVFPIGEFVQRNTKTEIALRTAISTIDRGYLSVLGPPGSGKSTLLQSGLHSTPDAIVIRYFAFLPDESHGLGRAEAEDFVFDLVGELKRTGLQGVRVHDGDLNQARDQFLHLLKKASERFASDGTKTVIVVDGLDHIPREETPTRSLLCELPRAEVVPSGVLFVLGSQHLTLSGLQTSASYQAAQAGRCVQVDPLSREAIHAFAGASGIDVAKCGDKVFDLSKGHPLAARYIIESLKRAKTAVEREQALLGEIAYDGDIKRIYEAAWKDISGNSDVRKVLAYVARSEGAIATSLLEDLVSRDAVEEAYRATSHLLSLRNDAWAVFHNSFRIFLLNQHELRYGKPDTTFSTRIYRELAEAAGRCGTSDPQSWLELRYRDKAGEHDAVIALATAERFRRQLAAGRSSTDIQIDIRLAFKALAGRPNTTKTFELILSRHEINRRSDVLAQAESIVDSRIQLGELDLARALIAEGGPVTKPYELVDVLLDSGYVEKARALFEEVEPLATFENHILGQDAALQAWAERAPRFRDGDQITSAIDDLASRATTTPEDAKRLAHDVRFTAARAAIIANPAAIPHEIADSLGLTADDEAFLAIEAAQVASELKDAPLASKQLALALPAVRVADVPRGWRRKVARIAYRLHDVDTAREIFRGLETPSIAELDRSYSSESVLPLSSAILEHFALGHALGENIAPPQAAKHSVHNAFQAHLTELGRLLGRVWSDSFNPAADVIGCIQRATSFLNNVSFGSSSDHSYRISQILQAAPMLVDVMTRLGHRYGPATYAEVQRILDEATDVPVGNLKRLDVRQAVALSAFDLDGDTEKAKARLEKAIPQTSDEDTPTAQVEEIASFAKSFATIGCDDRARQLLASVHEHTLGYEIAAKKDPQYILWRDIFERACVADPAGIPDRVAFLSRILSGMSRTEGSDAAYRITASVMEHAAAHSAVLAAAVVQHLIEHRLVTWSRILNNTLRGLVVRNPAIMPVAARLWVHLVLPYYQEPHYSESATGSFISRCIGLADASDLAETVELFARGVATEAGDHIRTALFEVLIAAARGRGQDVECLSDQLEAWRAIAPSRSRYSDDKVKSIFAGVTTLAEATVKLDEAGGKPDYVDTDRLAALIEQTPIDDVLVFFESRAQLLTDSRLRFRTAGAAIAQNRHDAARVILSDYDPLVDERSYWTPWYGGAKLEYHKLLAALDGNPARHNAAVALSDDLSRGRENILSLLPDLADVVEVIDANPDWQAIWIELTKYLEQFRDYALGNDLAADDLSLPRTDEDLLVSFFLRAFALEVPEVDRQARLAAAEIAALPSGAPVIKALVEALIDEGGNGPAEAMCLFAAAGTTSTVGNFFASIAQQLVDHPDVAVSVAAERLAADLNIPVAITKQPLPAFYKLTLPDEERGEDYDPPPGVATGQSWHLITSPLDYTFALEQPITVLSDASGISHLHIRQRCGHFMQMIGSIPEIQAREKVIRGVLDDLHMRMTYNRPLMAAVLVSFRQVAGEIYRAGLISGGMLALLLHRIGFPAVGAPPIAPTSRPPAIARPNLDSIGYGKERTAWLEHVDDELTPPVVMDDVVLAEYTTFVKLQVGDAATVERLRLNLPKLEHWTTVESVLDDLPRMTGLTDRTPIGKVSSASFVRRLAITGPPSIPETLLGLCPYVARDLKWSFHPRNPFLYVDGEGRVVSKICWWRDGSPRDFGDDVVRGEGCLVLVTAEGVQQMADCGLDIRLSSWASRSIGREAEGEAKEVKFASRAGK